MAGKKTRAKLGAKGAIAMARNPALRRTTARAGRPTAKVGWRVGKAAAKRKASDRLEQLGSAARTAGALWLIYGLPAAQGLGLIERPKPRRTGRVFVAGFAVGAAAMYFLEPEHGGEHRQRVQTMVGSSG